MSDKRYETYSLSDPSIFTGSIGDILVPMEVRQKLAKDLGFSYDLFMIMNSLDEQAATKLVETMSKQSKHDEIIILIDSDEVIGYTLETSRNPILNSEFQDRLMKVVSTTDEVVLDRVFYEEGSTISSAIIKKSTPIHIEEKYQHSESKIIDYNVGVLVTNNELESATCRLVVYVGHQPVYLPASTYSSSTTRYKKSTTNSLEALEVLILKIIDDIRDDVLLYKFQDMHYRYRYNKQIIATYEEYNSLLNTMRKMPSIIEDNSILDSLTSLFDDFERKYHDLKDQKSSFIWRCTAIGEITIGSLIEKACSILDDLYAPEIECLAVREVLGTYLSTSRIVEDIAKDSSL